MSERTKGATGEPSISLTFRWTLKTIYAAFRVAMGGRAVASACGIYVCQNYIWSHKVGRRLPAGMSQKRRQRRRRSPVFRQIEASAKYALNAQSVRHALRLPGKRQGYSAPCARICCQILIRTSAFSCYRCCLCVFLFSCFSFAFCGCERQSAKSQEPSSIFQKPSS